VHFNEYLKSCREHNHLTQEELVHDLYSYDIDSFEGLDTSTISKWERSITKPPPPKQVNIIKYFQKLTGVPLPCWDGYSIEETEDLICKAGMQNLIGKRLQLILDFPSKMMHVDDFKIYPVRSFERMNILLDINMGIHQTINHEYTQISLEQFKAWALHPNNLFIACEYKGGFMGLFFTLRLKPDVFNKIMNFEMKKSDITEDDFASFDEMGCNYILSFYALNQKCASILFIRYYAHLIANQRSIAQVGVITTMDDVKKVVSNMNLAYHANKTTKDQIEIQSYCQTLSNVLASENVVKMILLKQTCPED